MKPIGPNVFDFDTLIDRSSTISIKWSSSLRQKMYGDSNVIPMGIADMDFKCAPSVVAAINKRATHETYGYGFSSEAYLDACVNWQKRRNHWMIESDWITYIPGINMAIVVAVEMFTEPREKVIIQSPVYYPYYDYVTYKGRQIAFNPLLNKDGRYETDFSELEKIASQKDTRMLILCSPHNPVGRCWEKDEPKMVHEICERNNVKVVVDEIHSDLILGKNKFIPYATISENAADNCIICTSPSKSFNLAGLLVSDIIIPNEKIRKEFRYRMAPYYLWPGSFGSVAQIAAYNEGETWLEALLTYLQGNALFLDKFLKENLPKVQYRVPEATYLAWLDFRAYGFSTQQLKTLIHQKGKVATDDGTMLGPNGEGDGFHRLNFDCPRGLLEKALNQIAYAINSSDLKP